MTMSKSLDLICMGRAGVDLYGEQVGGRLEDMQSFRKYVGGCPTNIAVGTARLGLKSAMFSRVGDEHNGRFIRETLAKEGVDVGHLITDPDRLTALVFLGIKDRDTFPLIFYRENCADMALCAADVDADFIASAKALLVSGTHFSTETVDAACRAAIRAAKAAGARVVFDIDYRPVLWGLTGKGEGENRFVADAGVTEHLQSILPDCDLVVGTEEEFHIAGGSTDTLQALANVRTRTDATLVLKRGELGCSVYTDAIPASLDDGVSGRAFAIEVFNVLGAGDAFMSGFLRGWLKGEDLETCCTYANASGALVVTRHGCAPAIPSFDELQVFIDREGVGKCPDDDGGFAHLHRASTRWGAWPELEIMAFDHRIQFEDMADRVGVDRSRISDAKKLIAKAARRVGGDNAKAGVLVDGRWGEEALWDMTGVGQWVARPVELPASRPLEFDFNIGRNIAAHLNTWPKEQVVKCLVFYHPDDPADLKQAQEDKLLTLYDACIAADKELLIEIIPPKGSDVCSDTVSRAMTRLYDLGIRPDWWKLPPAPDRKAWVNISAVIEANDPYCRGVLLLGLEAPQDELAKGFAAVAEFPLVKGFAVGRTLFAKPVEDWLAGRIDDDTLVDQVAANYASLITIWRSSRKAAA